MTTNEQTRKGLITDKPKPSWITNQEWAVMESRDKRIRNIDKILSEGSEFEKVIISSVKMGFTITLVGFVAVLIFHLAK